MSYREQGAGLNPVGFFVMLTTLPWWTAILRNPFPVIIAIGACTVHSSIFDVIMMLVVGVLGYLFRKLRYPMAPLVLALVPGDMAESSFRRSMLILQGEFKNMRRRREAGAHLAR